MNNHPLLNASIKTKVYDSCTLLIADYKEEEESKAYDACQFKLSGLQIVYRTAKITPTKAGQFVVFWKRSALGPIAPFDEADAIDYYVVNVRTENHLGQFVFPKSVLVKKGILSTTIKEGKRAFRVYPPWDVAKSKQAIATQKWQLEYFLEVAEVVDLARAKALYSNQ